MIDAELFGQVFFHPRSDLCDQVAAGWPDVVFGVCAIQQNQGSQQAGACQGDRVKALFAVGGEGIEGSDIGHYGWRARPRHDWAADQCANAFGRKIRRHGRVGGAFRLLRLHQHFESKPGRIDGLGVTMAEISRDDEKRAGNQCRRRQVLEFVGEFAAEAENHRMFGVLMPL